MFVYTYNMKTKTMEVAVLHYPNLKTVLQVEKVLKEADGPITREEIKRRLPTAIMHPTLNIILSYFEERGMIYDGHKGISWIYTPSPKLQQIINSSVKVR